MAKLRVTLIDEVRKRRLKVDLPDDAAMEKLLPALAEKLGLPTTDPGGQPIAYQWTHEATGRALGEDQTLASFGVREGETLRLAAAREEAPVVPRPAVEVKPVEMVEEEAVSLWQKVPVWGWVGIGGMILLIAVAGAFVAVLFRKPEPTPTMVAEVTTPTATSSATARPTATPVAPTFTPLPPTATPTPTDTPVPTATPVPTDTPLPPTSTPVPPTPTVPPPTPTEAPTQPETPTPSAPPGSPYADRVVNYVSGPEAWPEIMDPNAALGASDGNPTFEPMTGWLCLGAGGLVTLEFVDNTIIDQPGPDFLIVGDPAQDDQILVEVSSDGNTWQAFPVSGENPPPLDLAAVRLPFARFVRIVDVQPGTQSGAEIDAIEALHSGPPQ